MLFASITYVCIITYNCYYNLCNYNNLHKTPVAPARWLLSFPSRTPACVLGKKGCTNAVLDVSRLCRACAFCLQMSQMSHMCAMCEWCERMCEWVCVLCAVSGLVYERMSIRVEWAICAYVWYVCDNVCYVNVCVPVLSEHPSLVTADEHQLILCLPVSVSYWRWDVHMWVLCVRMCQLNVCLLVLCITEVNVMNVWPMVMWKWCVWMW